MSSNITVVVVNESSVVTDAEASRVARALNTQAQHLAAAGYDISAKVRARATKIIEPLAWQLVLLDDSDQADALGYHETTDSGRPLGKVFARTCKDNNLSWTVCASHELVEMLVDPWAQLGADLGGGLWVAWEAADPVEADEYGYTIGDTLVSDFVTPAWFNPNAVGPYDWCQHLDKPLSLLPGGYVAVQRNGKWTQQVARESTPEADARRAMATRIYRRRAHSGDLDLG